MTTKSTHYVWQGIIVEEYEEGGWEADYSGPYYDPDLWRYCFEADNLMLDILRTQNEDGTYELLADIYLQFETSCEELAHADIHVDEARDYFPMETLLGLLIGELHASPEARRYATAIDSGLRLIGGVLEAVRA